MSGMGTVQKIGISWTSIAFRDPGPEIQPGDARRMLHWTTDSLSTLPLLNSVRLISLYIGSSTMPEVDKQANLWSHLDLALANIDRFPHLEVVRVALAYQSPGAEAERFRDDLRRQLPALAQSHKLEVDIA
jgi:hypothetical protein